MSDPISNDQFSAAAPPADLNPGWYEDPLATAMNPTERFWDGSKWTDQTRKSSVVAAGKARDLAGQTKAKLQPDEIATTARAAAVAVREKAEDSDLVNQAAGVVEGAKAGNPEHVKIVAGVVSALLLIVVVVVASC